MLLIMSHDMPLIDFTVLNFLCVSMASSGFLWFPGGLCLHREFYGLGLYIQHLLLNSAHTIDVAIATLSDSPVALPGG